jgi:hypothetical protein
MTQGNVKVSFTLLNYIHNSRLSKNPPFPPFEKGGNRKSPFVKGDLEGFSPPQHDFDETLQMTRWYGVAARKPGWDRS